MLARVGAFRPEPPELGRGEHGRQNPEGAIRRVGDHPHLVMQSDHVGAGDPGNPPPAEPGEHVLPDRTLVAVRGAGFAAGWDVFLHEAPGELVHGRRPRLSLSQVSPRQIPAGLGGGDDLGRTRPRGGRGNGAVGTDGLLHDAAVMAVLHEVDLAARRVDTHAEALDVVVPQHVLALPGGQGIDGSLGDPGHGFLPWMNCVLGPDRYPKDASRGKPRPARSSGLPSCRAAGAVIERTDTHMSEPSIPRAWSQSLRSRTAVGHIILPVTSATIFPFLRVHFGIG